MNAPNFNNINQKAKEKKSAKVAEHRDMSVDILGNERTLSLAQITYPSAQSMIKTTQQQDLHDGIQHDSVMARCCMCIPKRPVKILIIRVFSLHFYLHRHP